MMRVKAFLCLKICSSDRHISFVAYGHFGVYQQETRLSFQNNCLLLSKACKNLENQENEISVLPIMVQNCTSYSAGLPLNSNPPASPNSFALNCFGTEWVWLKFRAPSFLKFNFEP